MVCEKCSKEHDPEITCAAAAMKDLQERIDYVAPGWNRFENKSDQSSVKCALCHDRGRATSWTVWCPDCQIPIETGNPLGTLVKGMPEKLRRTACKCGRAVNLIEDLEVFESPCPNGCEAAQKWIEEAITGIRATDGPSMKP